MKKSSDSKKSKRKSDNKCKTCGKLQEVAYSGDIIEYPVFYCSFCDMKSSNEWEKWWTQYSELWKDPENWKEKKHSVSCLVGFMCNIYKTFYGFPYRFSYRSPIPYKDKAFIMARRILAFFDGDALRAGNYIKWVFAKKVRSRNYPLTSFGFFSNEAFVHEYEIARARAKVLRRATPLPEDFLQWCKTNEASTVEQEQLCTWDDLNGFVSHVKCYGLNNGQGRIVNYAIENGLLPKGPDFRKLED